MTTTKGKFLGGTLTPIPWKTRHFSPNSLSNMKIKRGPWPFPSILGIGILTADNVSVSLVMTPTVATPLPPFAHTFGPEGLVWSGAREVAGTEVCSGPSPKNPPPVRLVILGWHKDVQCFVHLFNSSLLIALARVGNGATVLEDCPDLPLQPRVKGLRGEG